MGYMSRQPNSNNPEGSSWNYGPQDPHDDFSALLNDLARRCVGCKRVAMKRYLNMVGMCPDCCAGTMTPPGK